MASEDGSTAADDFARLLAVFERTGRQGPGSEATTRRALRSLPAGLQVRRVLDLGCGTGGSTIVLARETSAHVIAVDSHAPFLRILSDHAARSGLSDRITTVVMDMAKAEDLGKDFDLIWAEGSAYSIGFTNALALWLPLLRPGGCLVVTELVWFAAEPSARARDFFAAVYPAMRDEASCVAVAQAAGFAVVDSFRLPPDDWRTYYAGVDEAVRQAVAEAGDCPLYAALRTERDMYVEFGDEYGYLCLILGSSG
ncbi:MAG: cyclopropane-fatty-acyl-phospholipid synthase family protein [Planctomycetota bacterium]